jgi:hypothetical protein
LSSASEEVSFSFEGSCWVGRADGEGVVPPLEEDTIRVRLQPTYFDQLYGQSRPDVLLCGRGFAIGVLAGFKAVAEVVCVWLFRENLVYQGIGC